jgi:hypothetical protein
MLQTPFFISYCLCSYLFIFPFHIWFYGSAIVIIRSWACCCGTSRENVIPTLQGRLGCFVKLEKSDVAGLLHVFEK